MKKVVFIFGFCFWVMQVDAQSTKGMSAYHDSEFRNAAQYFQEQYRLDSAMVDKLWMAKSYLQAGMQRNAKDIFHQLEDDDTYQQDAYQSLAAIYESEENMARAIKYYHKLNKIDSTNSFVLKKLGTLYMNSNIMDEAQTYLLEANIVNPEDITVMNSLAVLWMDTKQLTRADSLLDIAITLDSTNLKIGFLKARLSYIKKDYRAVCSILKNASHDTDLTNYYNKMLGFSYLQIDSLDKAIYHLTKSLVDEISPENAHYYLALAHSKRDEITYSKYHFEKAIESGISDNIGLYYFQLALISQEENKLKSAMRYFDKAYQFNKSPDMLYHYARCADEYYKDKSIAINWYKKYLKANPQNMTYSDYSLERMNYLKELQHLKR